MAKVGIVGRTGAGEQTFVLSIHFLIIFRQKFLVASPVQVKFPHIFLLLYVNVPIRAVELHNGKIEIDGYDISCIGLDVLRGRLALVPQDSTLFLGTLRENLWVLLIYLLAVSLMCFSFFQ
jgi:hypothetical protein